MAAYESVLGIVRQILHVLIDSDDIPNYPFQDLTSTGVKTGWPVILEFCPVDIFSYRGNKCTSKAQGDFFSAVRNVE